MRDFPAGFRLYADVLASFEEYRADGFAVSFRCVFPERHKHGDRNWSGRMWVGDAGQLVAGCFGCGAKRSEIIARSGTDHKAWYPDKGRNKPKGRRVMGKVVAGYPYHDADGQLLAIKERVEPGNNGSKKTFRWKRPLPAAERKRLGVPDGVDAWVWGNNAGKYGRFADAPGWNFSPQEKHGNTEIDMPFCEPSLYRLPELLAAAFESPACVVEGEKDTDNLTALGFVAVCPPHGSNAWSAEYSAHFTGRRVVIFADNDTPGLGHANAVGGYLLAARAASVRLVVPGREWTLPVGGDVSQWLDTLPAERATRRGALVALCKKFPTYNLTQLKAA